MKSREQIIAENPLEPLLVRRGVNLIGGGKQKSCRCLFHEDKQASMSINVGDNTWYCHACGFGGSVIDLLSRLENKQPADIIKQLAGNGAGTGVKTNSKSVIVKSYDYHNGTGEMVYQSCRLEPKSFRQRRPDKSNPGKWIWNMEGITRVLYKLPKLLMASAKVVWVVEGEKDADTLGRFGILATTNVGGAGKWCVAYSDCLRDKEVVLCGDNDDPGKKHIDDVLASLAGKVKLVRHVVIPPPHKDVSDLLSGIADTDSALLVLQKLYDNAAVFDRGVDLPVQSMAELEQEFRSSISKSDVNSFSFKNWIPTLGRLVRPLVPGEMAVVVADTSNGKTAVLQNMGIYSYPLITLLFEMELPGSLSFERFVALATETPTKEVFGVYKAGNSVNWRATGKLDHIYVCSKSKLTPAQIEDMVIKAELKIGKKPALVMVDYMQLIRGNSRDRYENVSMAAEEMKAIAKSTETVIIVASQVARKKKGDEENEVHLHDAKESGSIENSCGLMLGVWRDKTDKTLMKIKILKNTKGVPGAIVECNFDGERMLITERAKVEEEDVPK